MLPIPCPLEGCEEKVARKDMDEHHKQTCIYAEVACTYIKYGCQVKVTQPLQDCTNRSQCLRKDLEAHKKDSTLAHFGLLETYTQVWCDPNPVLIALEIRNWEEASRGPQGCFEAGKCFLQPAPTAYRRWQNSKQMYLGCLSWNQGSLITPGIQKQ